MPTPSQRAAEERLLHFLSKSGSLQTEALAAARSHADAEGISVVEALPGHAGIPEDEIAKILASGLRLPLLNLPTVPIAENAAALLDEPLATRFGVVPVRSEQETMILAMANPLDLDAVKDVEFRSGMRVRPAVAPRSQIFETIASVYKFDNSLRDLLNDVPSVENIGVGLLPDEDETGEASQPEELEEEAKKAPIVKMVNLILVEALKNRASDIHIEPAPNMLLVRYRIDGVLEDALEIPKWIQDPVIARLKVMARLDITERRVPQDGRLHIRFEDRVVDVRVSSLPTHYGEKIVMRVLDGSTALRHLDRLGLGERDIAVLREAIRRPEGMILVTGPTGSGKTTTLYAILQEIFTTERNIVTIENPIEYEMDGISQVEVNERQGLTFAGVLRSVLRQDPDVILVGEIRDRETAETAFRAAQTGHLVLSTLHTNDTTATVTRLLDLGIEPFLIASSLVTVVAQRLVRSNCRACASPVEVSDEAVEELGLESREGLRKGAGCPKCRKTGFHDRVGCYEVLDVSQPIQKLIERQASESALRHLAREEGMTTVRDDVVLKIEAGETTVEEALRVVRVDARGPACGSCHTPVEEGWSVCPYCNHQLRSNCASCEAALRPDWKSCPYCGAATGSPEPKPSPAPAEGESPVDTRPTPPPELAAGAIRKPRALVVDDTDVLRKIVRRTLEGVGMDVTEAADGVEALDRIAEQSPHCIVLDIMMPEMDGFEVCRRIRSDLKTAFIPIMMLTAKEDSESRVQGFLAGTDDYLVKPFQKEELVTRIQRLLARTYGYDASRAASAQGAEQIA